MPRSSLQIPDSAFLATRISLFLYFSTSLWCFGKFTVVANSIELNSTVSVPTTKTVNATTDTVDATTDTINATVNNTNCTSVENCTTVAPTTATTENERQRDEIIAVAVLTGVAGVCAAVIVIQCLTYVVSF